MHPRVQQFHTGNSFLKILILITIFFSVGLGIRATLESYLKALSHLCSFVKAQGCSRYRDGLSAPDRAQDYTNTRLNHWHRLLGILTIISLALQGCGTDVGEQGV